MPVLELMTSSGLGSLLGMRHALEPDHLAAVTTLVTGERSGYKAAFLGVCWGLGHTLRADRRRHRPRHSARGDAGARRRHVRILRGADADRPRPARDLPGGAARCRRAGACPPSRPHRARAQGRARARPHRHVDAGAASAPRRRGPWARRQRRAHRAGADDAADDRGAADLHGVFGLGSTLGMAALSGLLGWPLARAGQHQAWRARCRSPSAAPRRRSGVVWGYPLVGRARVLSSRVLDVLGFSFQF